jgi:hypothetical protein
MLPPYKTTIKLVLHISNFGLLDRRPEDETVQSERQ